MTWDEVKKRVEESGDIKTFTMEELRDANGSGKLGVNVRAEITKTLAGMGLGHVPQDLPSNQNELVRVYKHGTPVGDLIKTVLTPGGQNDVKLSEQFSSTSPNYVDIIEKIRELVSE